MHRIQLENGIFSKGIEVHDDLDAAVLSFWGRMKLAFNASSTITFMSCKITDGSGNVVRPYDMTWNRDAEYDNKFFMHHIRLDGETYSKDIDTCETFDAARAAFAAAMEYGHNNPRHATVSFVSCQITDRGGAVMEPFNETWVKPAETEQAQGA